MIKLFHIYKTDFGYYIPIELDNDYNEWFNGYLCQIENKKLSGWFNFTCMKKDIINGKIFD